MARPNTPHSSQIEGRIALAIQAYHAGYFASVRSAAKVYDVPNSTLHRRVQGGSPHCDLRPKSCKLTESEESALIKWIQCMDERGLSPTSDSVRQMANLLLGKRVSSSQGSLATVGQLWVYNFVRRYKTLQLRYNRKYDYQRAKCEDPILIRSWFHLVHNIIARYGIQPDDIYNFDETGFQMGVISTAKVITGAERSNRPVAIQPGNREWATAIDCISAAGWSLPPVIIFEGKVHQSTWYTEALPKDWSIAVSANGWTDDILGLTWLQRVFHIHTQHRKRGNYRLLILDGHGSHLTPEFDQFCREHMIITLCMPPYSSHLLQPLDVGCFSVLKRLYGQRIQQFMRDGVSHIDKQDFLEAYLSAHTATMKPANIHSSFAATGLVPSDPDRVLAKLNTQLKTPTPPPATTPEQDQEQKQEQEQEQELETPDNTVKLERQYRAIKSFIKRRLQSPPTPTSLAIDQYHKGSQLTMHRLTILEERVKQLEAENKRQKVKRAKRRSYIATGGVLTVQEGLDRSKIVDVQVTDEVADQEHEVKTRAPRTCSMCKSLSHTARICPQREVFN